MAIPLHSYIIRLVDNCILASVIVCVIGWDACTSWTSCSRQWGTYAGSTGLMSTSADIAKWMLMQLGGGRNQAGQQVLTKYDLDLTHSGQTTIRASTVEKMFHKPQAPFTVTETNYAYGWKSGFYKGRRCLRAKVYLNNQSRQWLKRIQSHSEPQVLYIFIHS